MKAIKGIVVLLALLFLSGSALAYPLPMAMALGGGPGGELLESGPWSTSKDGFRMGEVVQEIVPGELYRYVYTLTVGQGLAFPNHILIPISTVFQEKNVFSAPGSPPLPLSDSVGLSASAISFPLPFPDPGTTYHLGWFPGLFGPVYAIEILDPRYWNEFWSDMAPVWGGVYATDGVSFAYTLSFGQPEQSFGPGGRPIGYMAVPGPLIAASVPEPESLVLIALALLVMGAAVYRSPAPKK